MSPETAAPAETVSDDWPPGEAEARIRLLMWLGEQIAAGAVEPQPGDWVLATDGRIIGHGPDPAEVERRAVEADPTLKGARIVASVHWPYDLLPEVIPCPDSGCTSADCIRPSPTAKFGPTGRWAGSPPSGCSPTPGCFRRWCWRPGPLCR